MNTITTPTLFFFYSLSVIAAGIVFVGLAAIEETAQATTPFAGALEPETARVIELKVYEDGIGYLEYSNGTKLQFYHNFLDPGYLYNNGIILLENMTEEVSLD